MKGLRPESAEYLPKDVSYSDALELVRQLEDDVELIDTGISYIDVDDRDVFTYKVGDELASVRQEGEEVLVEGSQEAKDVLDSLDSS